MNVDIYRCTKHRLKFISLPTGTNIKTFAFPADLDKGLLHVAKLKSVALDPEKPLVGMDVHDVMAQINARGFAVHGVEIAFEESTKGAA